MCGGMAETLCVCVWGGWEVQTFLFDKVHNALAVRQRDHVGLGKDVLELLIGSNTGVLLLLGLNHHIGWRRRGWWRFIGRNEARGRSSTGCSGGGRLAQSAGKRCRRRLCWEAAVVGRIGGGVCRVHAPSSSHGAGSGRERRRSRDRALPRRLGVQRAVQGRDGNGRPSARRCGTAALGQRLRQRVPHTRLRAALLRCWTAAQAGGSRRVGHRHAVRCRIRSSHCCRGRQHVLRGGGC